MPLIKICGTTTIEDARLAFEAGADFVGAVIHPPSPRHVAPENLPTLRGDWPLVLVSVNRTVEELADWAKFGVYALQLHGDESPELVRDLVRDGFRVWKVVHGEEFQLRRAAQIFTEAGAEALVIDARETSSRGTIYGGTGKFADWNAARSLVEDGHQLVLAGGLSPENVRRATEFVGPWAVDVASGVEAQKGVKDVEKVRSFVANAKELSRR